MQHLEAERVMAAYGSIGTVEHTLALAKEYVKQRILFGKPLSSFQNTQYKLAQLNTEYNLALNYLRPTSCSTTWPARRTSTPTAP